MSTISEHDDEPGTRTAGWYPDPSSVKPVWSSSWQPRATAPSATAPVIKNPVATVGLVIGIGGLVVTIVLGPWVPLVALIVGA